MLHLHCWARVPDEAKRNELLSKLRHHNTPFSLKCCMVSVDANFLSYRSVERLISYFDDTDAEERGLSLIANEEDVNYDLG